MPGKPCLLVTGGSGYIGSLLVLEALEAGYTVHVLDNSDLPSNPELDTAHAEGQLKLFKGSITDPDLIWESLTGVQSVIHLAGISDGRAGKANPDQTREVNTGALTTLIEAVQHARVRRFVFASTMGVYGNHYSGKLVESLPLVPVDPYSQSKADGERLLEAVASSTLCITILRIAMVYGAGIKIREDFLLNKMCQLAVREQKITVTGGCQKRPQIHLQDLTSLFLNLLKTDVTLINGLAFNVVESNPSLERMAQTICALMPQVTLETQPGRDQEDSFEMDGSKLKTVVGFVPKTDLPEGIRQTIQYFKQQEQGKS